MESEIYSSPHDEDENYDEDHFDENNGDGIENGEAVLHEKGATDEYTDPEQEDEYNEDMPVGS